MKEGVENAEKMDLIRAGRRSVETLLERVIALRLDLLRTQQMVETASALESPGLGSGEQDLCSLVSTLRWVLLDLDAIEDGRMPPLMALRRAAENARAT